MTTTNLNGVLETNKGLFHLEGEPTDAASASELKVRDISGTSQSLKDIIRGATITRIAIQASDGSVLTSVAVYQNGAVVNSYYAGERIANSPERYNIDIRGIAVVVGETTQIKVVVNE